MQSISGFKAGSYQYDLNGNLKSDGPRTSEVITYNILNLPQTVTATGVNISYLYDATGNKLRKVSNGAATDYSNGIQYKPDGTIDFIQTEEGCAIRSGTNYNYEYTLTDNRVMFDQTTGFVGEEDYYPFGLNAHRKLNGAGNKYLYNQKELQEELTEYCKSWMVTIQDFSQWRIASILTLLLKGSYKTKIINHYEYVTCIPHIISAFLFNTANTETNKIAPPTFYPLKSYSNKLYDEPFFKEEHFNTVNNRQTRDITRSYYTSETIIVEGTAKQFLRNFDVTLRNDALFFHLTDTPFSNGFYDLKFVKSPNSLDAFCSQTFSVSDTSYKSPVFALRTGFGIV